MNINSFQVQDIVQNAIRTCDNVGDNETAKFIKHQILSPVLQLKNNDECNGWSNYATWRVNMELLEGEADAIREDGQVFDTIGDLADHLEQMVDDYMDMQEVNNTIVEGYANAFLQDVNWYEIAENMAADNPEFVKEEK